ncbi:hypothetical protein QWJ07_31485 [Frankia sp. RB7]|nr:hypothetical protein [Frankia sp. RB7]
MNTFDPDEIVTLDGAKMTLRKAVARATSLPSNALVSVFREGEPPILDRPQLDALARDPAFRVDD